MERLAVDGHAGVLGGIEIRGKLIVLVSDVAFQRPEVQIPGDVISVCRISVWHQENVKIGTVGDFEVLEAENLASVLEFVDSCSA